MPGRVTAPGFLLHLILLRRLSSALRLLLRFRNVGSFRQNGQWPVGVASIALPQILADELDADWEQVKVRFVTGKAASTTAFPQGPPPPVPGQ